LSGGGLKIYAIIETGGKQYKITPGQTVDIDLLDVTEGGTIELDRVLLIANGEQVAVGTPTVDGAKVVATSQGNGRSKKTIVFKYKSKVRYRKKTGHRQHYTRLVIDKIVEPKAKQDKPAKKTRRAKKEVTESGT
jgi:large subunit ribosomal protein L21